MRTRARSLPNGWCARAGTLASMGWPAGETSFCREVYAAGATEERRCALSFWICKPSRCWHKAANGPVLKHGPRSLTCTRVGGWKTRERKETDWWDGLCLHHRPTMIFCERFEYERTCWDPKDGELCLSRAKPEETLVEARRCADVQIAFRTWV